MLGDMKAQAEKVRQLWIRVSIPSHRSSDKRRMYDRWLQNAQYLVLHHLQRRLRNLWEDSTRGYWNRLQRSAQPISFRRSEQSFEVIPSIMRYTQSLANSPKPSTKDGSDSEDDGWSDDDAPKAAKAAAPPPPPANMAAVKKAVRALCLDYIQTHLLCNSFRNRYLRTG